MVYHPSLPEDLKLLFLLVLSQGLALCAARETQVWA